MRFPCVRVASWWVLMALVACGDNQASLDSGLGRRDGELADAGSDVDSDVDSDVRMDAGPSRTPLQAVDIHFPQSGPIGGAGGQGSFTFGAATAGAQIEEGNIASDWWIWSTREEDGGLGHGEAAVGEASGGYARAVADVELLEELNLDAYRFSVEWSRIEPARDVIDEAALAHYSALLDALVEANIKPLVTVHHFSSPTWVDDPRREDACPLGPTDADLCGLHTEAGADLIIEEMAEHARLIAERYGDRVDEWATVNEPINYLLSSYGVGLFPPGRSLLLEDFETFITVFRNYVRLHVAIYDAIKAADVVDADGDGVAAHIGFTLSVADWVPAFQNRVSDRASDIAAANNVRYVYHYLFQDSLQNGSFDTDLDGEPNETHPDWAGKNDWLGVQYYFRAGVTGSPALIPGVNATPCFGTFDFGACVSPIEESHVVPAMGYEYSEPGVYDILKDFAERWPTLPMTVTESGLATEVGERRAEHIVRSLEWIWQAREEGVDVRGYYHWSLFDNFEWVEGFTPRFGLYNVDFETYERTPTAGASELGQIVGDRLLSSETRETSGGLGPMTLEP